MNKLKDSSSASETVLGAVVMKMAYDLVGEVASNTTQNAFDEDLFATEIVRANTVGLLLFHRL